MWENGREEQGVKQIVCESMRVIERLRGGGGLNCIWQGKKGGRKKREGESVFIFFSWKNISFWDESDLERVLGGWGAAKILTNFNLVITSALVLCQRNRAVHPKPCASLSIGVYTRDIFKPAATYSVTEGWQCLRHNGGFTLLYREVWPQRCIKVFLVHLRTSSRLCESP